MEYQKTPVSIVYASNNSEQRQFLFLEKKNEQLIKAAVETDGLELLDYEQFSNMENLARALRNNKDFRAHLEILLISSLEEGSSPDGGDIFYNKETFGQTLEDLLENKYSSEKIVKELDILIQTCQTLKEEGG